MNIRSVSAAALLIVVPTLIVLSFPDQPMPDLPEVDLTVESLKPSRHLKPFRSDADLRAYFKRRSERERREQQASKQAGQTTSANATVDVAASEAQVTSDDSVTNNQHAGVDEGGIVKLYGEHLVVLRRGRLFTIRVGGNDLTPVSSVDAYAPNVDPRGDWYDEMLIYRNTVVVIGYSYGRGGTELNLFDLSESGKLAYRSTYHLRSNDYYSSRNYASRLIGGKLIFYTPQYLDHSDDNPYENMPAVRKWRSEGTNDNGDFRTIMEPTRIYRAESLDDSSFSSALHTVTVCDLDSRDLDCKATGVLGAPGRVFYVSPGSVYVWTTDWQYRSESRPKAASMLYSLPLDGSAPSAMGVAGAPIDQFSFLEGNDEHLNVLVRPDGSGEQMWGSESAPGNLALLRVPLDAFGDGSRAASRLRYREMPALDGYTAQNRFIGDHVLYGNGTGWGRPREGTKGRLYVADYKRGGTTSIELNHGVDRIEAIGRNAVAVGSSGRDLHFTPVRLGAEPKAETAYVRENASQGETRSHGFFYKASQNGGGTLGLPVARSGRPGYRQLVEGSAAVVFLRNDDMKFSELGELGSREARSPNDGCKASCVDWYGNARPLFIGDRIFALMGYEMVEGHIVRGYIYTKRRVDFSPKASGSTE